MVALHLGPGVDELQHPFALLERAIALADGQPEAFAEPSVSADLELRQTGSVRPAGEIHVGYSGCLAGILAVIQGLNVDAVAHVAEPEIGQQGRTEYIVEAADQILVAHVRYTGEADGVIPGPARHRTERRRRVLIELGVGIAAKVAEGVLHVVIGPDVELIPIERLGTGRDEIVVVRSGSAKIRRRQERDEVLGWRRKLAGRDLVVGELDAAASVRVAGVRIEDRYAQSAEIAVALRGCGDSRHARAAGTAPRTLVVAKDKQLVLLDGSSERTAELVPAQRWRAVWLAERVPGIGDVVLEELEQAAMEFVGARLGFDLQHGATGLRVLGVVVAGCVLELGDRIDGRIHHDNAQNRVVVVGAIDHEVVGAESLAVGVDLDTLLRVLTGGMLPRHLLCTRHEQLQGRKIPVQCRQVADLCGDQTGAHLRAIRDQRRRRAGHADLLGHLADDELRIHPGRTVETDRYVLLNKALEAGRFELERVKARQDVNLRIVAGFVGSSVVGCAALLTGNRDLHGRNADTRRIRNRTDEVAGRGLAIKAEARAGNRQNCNQ